MRRLSAFLAGMFTLFCLACGSNPAAEPKPISTASADLVAIAEPTPSPTIIERFEPTAGPTVVPSDPPLRQQSQIPPTSTPLPLSPSAAVALNFNTSAVQTTPERWESCFTAFMQGQQAEDAGDSRYSAIRVYVDAYCGGIGPKASSSGIADCAAGNELAKQLQAMIDTHVSRGQSVYFLSFAKQETNTARVAAGCFPPIQAAPVAPTPVVIYMTEDQLGYAMPGSIPPGAQIVIIPSSPPLSSVAGNDMEAVTFVKSVDDSHAVIRRKTGGAYLLEYGVGCMSLSIMIEGRMLYVYSPGLFAGIGSKIILPDRGQECRVWDAILL